MPLFDAKTLDNDFNGSALLASVLFATPEDRENARARGMARLASFGSSADSMRADAVVAPGFQPEPRAATVA